MLMASLLASTLLVSLPSGSAVQLASDDTPIRLEDITVEGTPRRLLIDRFVANVAHPAPDRQVARWSTRDSFCVGILNMPQEVSEYVADRIGDVARELDLRVGTPGCKPTVILIASSGSHSIQNWIRDELRNNLVQNIHGTSAGEDDFDRFIDSNAAVRWWHVSYVTSNHNDHGVPGDFATADSLSGIKISHQVASRILSGDSDFLRSIVIIFDPEKLTDLTTDQITSYLTFISLAQVNPQANTESYDSILNVVSHPTEVASLTDWDIAYLKGLYSAQRTQKVIDAGRDEIASSIERQAHLLATTNQ